MLTRFFNKSEPFGFIALVALSVIMVSATVFINGNLSSENLIYAVSFLLFLIVLLTIASSAISTNNLTSKDYYALFVFVLLFGFFPTTIILTKISFAHLFILLAARRIYGLQYKKERNLKLFDIGLFLGIAYLLYPLSIVFLIVAFTAYFFFIKNIEKELFIPIIGFLTPIFLIYVYFIIFKKPKDFITLIEFNIGFDNIIYNTSRFYATLFLVGIVFYALYSNVKNLHKGGVDKQRNTKLILSHLVFAVIVIALYLSDTKAAIQFVFFPVAVLIGNSIVNIKKNWIKELLLLSLFIGSIVNLFTT